MAQSATVVPMNDLNAINVSKRNRIVPDPISGASLAQMDLSTSTDALDNRYTMQTAINQNGFGSKVKEKSKWTKGNIRIKYSGYGEEYAINKIKHTENTLENKRFKNLRRGRNDPGCYIDPHTTFMKRWDPYMTILLLYTALVTPYEVAFLGSPASYEERFADPLWIFNQIVNISFTVDLGFNFFLAYTDETTGIMVNSSGAIVKHYIGFWFWIDLASIIPFDLLAEIGQDPTATANPGSLKTIRLVRLLRLLKLIRILKASRIFGRIQSRLGLSYAELSLYKFAVFLIVLAHWLAVMWFMGSTLLSDEWLNWATNYGMYGDVEDHWSHYTTSIYWAFMTLTTIGYGDVVPVTDGERWVAVFAMAVGGAFYAYMVGAVCGIVSSMDIAGIEYRQTMDNLNSYLDECDAPPHLRFKLREYFTASKEQAKQKFYQAVIEQLSPGLKAELAGFVNQDWIDKIYFLATGSSEKSQNAFTAAVAMRLVGRTYPSTEYIIRMGDTTGQMYIIQKGLVARMNAVLSTGRHFGEDVVLHNALRLYTVRALTFLSVYCLKREDLEDVLNSPDFMFQKKIVRRATIKLAMRNTFINFHNIVLKMRQWRRHQQAGTLEDDWKTQRDQYFRYISANAIYKTLKERKGDKALELIGFDDSFWGTSNPANLRSTKPQTDEEGSTKATIRALRDQIDRLENQLEQKN